MKILQWLHLTGEVDKSVRCSCKIISGFNIPKNRFIFDSSELKRWTFSGTQCTVAAAVKCIVFIQTGFCVCADYVQKQSLGGCTEAGG